MRHLKQMVAANASSEAGDGDPFNKQSLRS